MCEIGWRVRVKQGSGIVIGHLGFEWAVISLDSGGGVVVVPEGSARPQLGTKGRAVVIHRDGQASPLSRADTARVRIRPAR